jgi:hypothetical protein
MTTRYIFTRWPGSRKSGSRSDYPNDSAEALDNMSSSNRSLNYVPSRISRARRAVAAQSALKCLGNGTVTLALTPCEAINTDPIR